MIISAFEGYKDCDANMMVSLGRIVLKFSAYSFVCGKCYKKIDVLNFFRKIGNHGFSSPISNNGMDRENYAVSPGSTYSQHLSGIIYLLIKKSAFLGCRKG